MALEAAFGWGWLLELLEDYGFEPHLVHPTQCKAIASARLNNNRVDAQTGELVAPGEADNRGAGSSPSRSVQIWTRACTGWGWPGTATRSRSSSNTP